MAGRPASRRRSKATSPPAQMRRGRPMSGTSPPTPGAADLCFLTDQPLAGWQAHLDAGGVTVEA